MSIASPAAIGAWRGASGLATTGRANRYLRQVDVIVPDILVQAGDLIELPAGSFPPSLDPDKVVGRTLGLGDPSMAALRNPATQRAFLFGTYSETENCPAKGGCGGRRSPASLFRPAGRADEGGHGSGLGA